MDTYILIITGIVIYNLHIVVSHFIGKDLQLHFPSLRGLYFRGHSKPSGSFKGGEMGQGLKLLGVRLDHLLSWSDQIDHIVSKMGRGIAMSRKCSVYCPTATLKNVVQSLVLSHLYYCPVVWTSAAQTHRRKLQIAQNRAARVALHCSFRASVREMHIK